MVPITNVVRPSFGPLAGPQPAVILARDEYIGLVRGRKARPELCLSLPPSSLCLTGGPVPASSPICPSHPRDCWAAMDQSTHDTSISDFQNNQCHHSRSHFPGTLYLTDHGRWIPPTSLSYPGTRHLVRLNPRRSDASVSSTDLR